MFKKKTEAMINFSRDLRTNTFLNDLSLTIDKIKSYFMLLVTKH